MRNTKVWRAVWLLALVCTGIPASAQTETGVAHDELSWLTGEWVDSGEEGSFFPGGPGSAELRWGAPHEGMRTGIFRMAIPGSDPVFLLMTISGETDGSRTLRYRHFDRSLGALEALDDPVWFPQTQIQSGDITFANPDNVGRGAYLSVRYVALGEDSLEIRMERPSGGSMDILRFVRPNNSP